MCLINHFKEFFQNFNKTYKINLGEIQGMLNIIWVQHFKDKLMEAK